MENNSSPENLKKQFKETFLTDLEILTQFKNSVAPKQDKSENGEADFKFRNDDVLNEVDKKIQIEKDNLLSNEDEKILPDSD